MDKDKALAGQQPRESQHNWGSFAMCAVGTFRYIPDDQAPPECRWELDRTLLETARNFEVAEAPFLSQIEDVIRTLCETGSASTSSKAVAYFLGWRSAVLEPFFFLLSVGSPVRRTIVPFPALPVLRVIEFFYVDWWRIWGPLEAAKVRFIDDWDERFADFERASGA